jgi:hypothetical protein
LLPVWSPRWGRPWQPSMHMCGRRDGPKAPGRAQGTRHKYVTHRLSILTWAVWKGCLDRLLPMSDDLLRAYIWDSLAFEASLPVLKHAIGAIKAWHQRLGMPAPADGPRN